jgi:hypothetical protein
LTRGKKKKKKKNPPIKISIVRIFNYFGHWKNQELGGAHRCLVAIVAPMFFHAPMQLGKVLTFCKATSISKKINN